MEIIANELQTVETNQNVLFTDVVVNGNCPAIVHRSGSGLITLRGLTKQCRARFRATFGANIAVPTGGTAGPISLALAINGESVPATTMIVTPTAVASFFNVASSIYIDIPAGCCGNLSVQNISGDTIAVQNANLIIERVA